MEPNQSTGDDYSREGDRPSLILHDAWMLAIAIPTFHWLVGAAAARHVLEAFAATARELASMEHSPSIACGERTCVEESLARDRRVIECQTLDGELARITAPLRQELMLVSSVIC